MARPWLTKIFRRKPGDDAGERSTKPVKTPTRLQLEALECGAAALGIILSYHGRWIPLEKLRIACGVSRDGSKASNMVKAARKYGMVAQGFKREPQHLRSIKAPMVLHWNFNHFLVLEGFHKGNVYLNDPASGPRIVSEQELDESFTGVVLTFEPGDAFEREGSPPRLLPALIQRLASLRAAVLFVLLAGLALVVPGLATPVFTRVFIDNVLVRGFHDWLGPLLLA
ncbi:MAG: cysteine peptidase family C39 domain-containing protein, partial [Acidobacteriota bacterium]